MTDLDLLCQYLAGDSDAFTQIVRRHVDLVYSACLRQVRDPHLAEDITQAVFIVLARKARTIRPNIILSAWLLRTARYAAIDALRAQSRRRHHEREAAQMNPTVTLPTGDHSEIECLSAVLDDALSRLSTRDLNIISLHYFERKGHDAVAAQFGVSANVVAQRLSRALTRLRKLCGARGAPLQVPAMSAFLTADAVQAAPQHLSAAASIGALAGTATAATPSVTAIADGVVKLIAWAQIKIAAGWILAVALFAAAGTTAVTVRESATQSAVSSTPAAMAPSAALAQRAPSKSEVIQLARWSMILNQAGADQIAPVGRPLVTTSLVYEAITCDGDELRHAVRDAMQAGNLARNSPRIDMAENWPGQTKLFFIDGLALGAADRPGDRVMIGGTIGGGDDCQRVAADRVHLKLSYPKMRLDINELTDRWRWSGLPGQAIDFESDLPAGQAVAFLGKFIAASGAPYYHLIVWETFKAEAQHMEYIRNQHNAEWWCQNGPAPMLMWADAARVWAAGATHSSTQPAPAFERTLEDGKILRLAALTRPSRWPFCWWDAQGNPAAAYNGMIALSGDPPQGLWAAVHVKGSGEQQYPLMTPTGKRRPLAAEYNDIHSERIADGDTSIEVGVLVGPWKEMARLQPGESRTIDGVTYRIELPSAFGDMQFVVHFTRTGVLDNEDCLTAVGQDGFETEPYVEQIVFGPRNVATRTVKEQPNFHGVPLEKVKYFRLTQRKRQWVTFSGFATQPKALPPTAVTAEQVVAAEDEQARRAARAKLEELLQQRKGWAAVVPARTSQLGAVRMFVDAVKKGDANSARRLLAADEPIANRFADAALPLLVRIEAVRARLVARFGELAVRERLANEGICGDIEADLMGGEWKKTADGDLENGFILIKRHPDGQCFLHIKPPPPKTDLDQQVQLATQRLEQVDRLLAQQPQLTLDELKAAMRPGPATAPAPR